MISQDTFRDRSHAVRQSARAHLLDIRRARLAKRGQHPPPEAFVPEACASESDLPEGALPEARSMKSITSQPPAIAPISEPDVTVAAQTHADEAIPTKAIFAEAASPEPAIQDATLLVSAQRDADQADDLDRIATLIAAQPEAERDSPPLDQTPAKTINRMPALASDASKPAVPSLLKPHPVAQTMDPSDLVHDLAMRQAALAALQDAAPAAPLPAAASLAASLWSSTTPTDPAPTQPTNVPVPLAEAPATQGEVQVAKPQSSDLATLPGAGPGLIWMLQQCGIQTLEDLAQIDAAALVPKLGLVGQLLNVDIWQDFARQTTSAR